MIRIAIVGGGPGGLMTAYLLEEKYKDSCQTTLFEASNRTGGKLVTEHFKTAPVIYEAGVAEFYAYSMIGPDPLRQLIKKLGLKTVPMDGQTVVLDGRILRNKKEIRQLCGADTLRAIEDFRRRGAEAMPLDVWYEGYWQDDNKHPWAQRSCESVLDEVPDAAARKYLQVAAHSDLATEPHLTSGLNGLKNFLMDVPGYIRLYSVEGGIERLTEELRGRLTHTSIELNAPVVRIEKIPMTLTACITAATAKLRRRILMRSLLRCRITGSAASNGAATHCGGRCQSTLLITTGPRITCACRCFSKSRSGAG